MATPKINPDKLRVLLNTVLIEQDKSEEKVGNIMLPDSVKEVNKFAVMTGVVRKIGSTAFSYGNPKKPEEYWRDPDAPKVGDHVWFRKYAGGQVLDGDDGEVFRFIDHSDIIATETE